ncbi:hypothetical protein DFN06_002510 [Clostridium beijerinckii]|nr:hypothetical protein [Clostridium beijerinckii]
MISGIIDKAEFEKLKRTGDKAIYIAGFISS